MFLEEPKVRMKQEAFKPLTSSWLHHALFQTKVNTNMLDKKDKTIKTLSLYCPLLQFEMLFYVKKRRQKQ